MDIFLQQEYFPRGDRGPPRVSLYGGRRIGGGAKPQDAGGVKKFSKIKQKFQL